MELTKFEKMIMDSRNLRKCRWYFLYLGIALVVTGMIVLAIGYKKAIPKSTAAWNKTLTKLQTIVPKTKNEMVLFDIAKSSLESAKEGWNKFIEAKTTSASFYFITIGIFFIGTYIREKRYRILIEKISAPNQPLNSDG